MEQFIQIKESGSSKLDSILFFFFFFFFFFFGCKVQTEPRCSPLVFYFFFLPKGIRIFKIWKPNFFFINFFIGERERERERERDVIWMLNILILFEKKKKESWCWTFWFSFVPKKKKIWNPIFKIQISHI